MLFVPVGAVASPAGDPAPNDACSDALPIVGERAFPFDNGPATPDDGHGEFGTDVWYCWTAPCDGEVTVDTCGGTAVDTKIAVYEGCSCPPTTWLGEDDDACVYQSRVTFSALAGSDYLVRIGTNPSVRGDAGTFTVSCGPAPVPPCQQTAENCQAPDGWDALASNRTESVVADDFTPAIDGAVSDICWWGIYDDVPAGDDSFDVSYYVDDGGVPGALLAGPFSQADGSLVVQGPTRTYGRLADSDPEYEYSATHEPVPVTSGMCYWLEISNQLTGSESWYWEVAAAGNGRALQDGQAAAGRDGYDPQDAVGRDLAFCLGLPLGESEACFPMVANDTCADALPIQEGETFFDTTGATTDGWYSNYLTLPQTGNCSWLGDARNHRDIWFDYTAPCSGVLTVRLCESSFDTKVWIHNTLACPASGIPHACDDDGCAAPNTQQSQIQLSVTRGREYKIRVGGYTSLVTTDCGIPREEVGCSNPNCEAVVCARYPYCCATSWDFACTYKAFELCGGRGGPGTIELELTAEPPIELDLADYALFANCFTSACGDPPCDPPLHTDPCCLNADFDNDGDSDLEDYAALLSGFSGP